MRNSQSLTMIYERSINIYCNEWLIRNTESANGAINQFTKTIHHTETLRLKKFQFSETFGTPQLCKNYVAKYINLEIFRKIYLE